MEERKVLDAIITYGLRELIDTLNSLKVDKEDIVQILTKEDKYIAIFYSK